MARTCHSTPLWRPSPTCAGACPAWRCLTVVVSRWPSPERSSTGTGTRTGTEGGQLTGSAHSLINTAERAPRCGWPSCSDSAPSWRPLAGVSVRPRTRPQRAPRLSPTLEASIARRLRTQLASTGTREHAAGRRPAATVVYSLPVPSTKSPLVRALAVPVRYWQPEAERQPGLWSQWIRRPGGHARARHGAFLGTVAS